VAACFCDVSIFDQEIQRCANFRDSGASDFRSSSGCALEAHFRHAVDEEGAEPKLRKFCICAATYLGSRGVESVRVSVRIQSVLKVSSTKEGQSPYRESV
jgi:hypothetical protein